MSRNERIVLMRVYEADLEDVWELWTTKEGIESWWGPEGFRVTVHSLDLRPRGVMRYAMHAVAPETVAFMQRNGMPTTTESRVTFTDVVPKRRLAYLHVADFVPGVPPYDVAHQIDLAVQGDTVKLTLTIDRMHDEEWTKRAVMGWEMELGFLGEVLAGRRVK
ncbi:MAG: SRPBCC domain-containing protein [Anaeromyxobacter sp.]